MGFPCNIHQVAQRSGDVWTIAAPDHKRRITHCRTLQPMAVDQGHARDMHPGLINLWWAGLRRGCLVN